METVIPFGGFYGSLWDGEIDYLEDQLLENLSDDWPDLEDGIWDVLNKNTDYQAMHLEIAFAYTDALKDLINEELGLNITLNYVEMTSPREYNFTTDRIFCTIDLEDFKVLYERVGRDAVAQKARDMFTSRSGFASFYDPDIDTWGSLEDWDHNQCLAVFSAVTALLGDEYEMTLRENLTNEIDTAYQNNVDWVAVERDLTYLLEVQNGEAEEDARKFPAGSTQNMHQYAQKFSELNHHKEGS